MKYLHKLNIFKNFYKPSFNTKIMNNNTIKKITKHILLSLQDTDFTFKLFVTMNQSLNN